MGQRLAQARSSGFTARSSRDQAKGRRQASHAPETDSRFFFCSCLGFEGSEQVAKVDRQRSVQATRERQQHARVQRRVLQLLTRERALLPI